ncbi:hypothetical protein ACOSP7_011207 [Xanthoceras sorbifolium]
MEKLQAAKSKNKLLKLLPKAAGAVVSFQNPPFSPSRDKRSSDHHHYHHLRGAHHHQAGRGFSGPILVSMIPDEARRKSKNDQSLFETQEPTSPKVSCMGQIKQRHKEKKKIKKAVVDNNKKKSFSLPKDIKPPATTALSSPSELKKRASKLRRIFTGSSKQSRKSDDHVYDNDDDENIESPQLPTDRAPALSQMKRFASGRNSLGDFDWTTAQVFTPVDSYHRNYYSDDEERGDSDGEQEPEVIIPFSAPIMVGGSGVSLQPRNEINLWKRRTMNPPRPLQLNPLMIKTNC